MAMHFLMNYTVLTVKSCVKLFECQAEASLPRHKRFGNGQFNPVTDRTTCHRSLFQAYEFAIYFRKSRAVTSLTMLVSKGRHCHWDYRTAIYWKELSSWLSARAALMLFLVFVFLSCLVF